MVSVSGCGGVVGGCGEVGCHGVGVGAGVGVVGAVVVGVGVAVGAGVGVAVGSGVGVAVGFGVGVAVGAVFFLDGDTESAFSIENMSDTFSLSCHFFVSSRFTQPSVPSLEVSPHLEPSSPSTS